jgi:hypothetical protein
VGAAAARTAPKVNTLHSSLGKFDGVLAGLGINLGPQIRGIEEIGSAAGKTSKEVGVLGTAGLALGAGLAGWQLGRLAAEFFNLDEKIANATAKLLGWGDVAGEVAGAKQDTINAAIKRGAAATISYTEAIQFMNVAMDQSVKATVATVEATNKGLEERAAAMKRAAAESQRLREEERKLAEETRKAHDEIMSFSLGIDHSMIPVVRRLGTEVKLIAPELNALISPLKITNEMIPAGVARLGTEVAIVVPKVEEVTAGIGDLSASMAQLAQISGGAFGKMSGGFATIIGSADAADKALDTFKSGLGKGLGGITSMATGIGGVITAALAAAQAIKAMWGALDRNKGRDLVKDFAGSMGGFDALHRELLTLGAEGESLWVRLTQGVGRNNPTEAQAAIDAVTGAFERQRIKAGEVADAVGATLPTYGDVTSAAERYGLTVDGIGHNIHALRITETAEQAIKDWKLLETAGADMVAVASGMTDEVQALIDEALKFGHELPGAMRPMLEQMVGAGELTDETGEKLKDLSGLKFAEPLTESVDRIILKLDELIDKLNGDVAGAFGNLGKNIPENVVPFPRNGGGGFAAKDGNQTIHTHVNVDGHEVAQAIVRVAKREKLVS